MGAWRSYTGRAFFQRIDRSMLSDTGYVTMDVKEFRACAKYRRARLQNRLATHVDQVVKEDLTPDAGYHSGAYMRRITSISFIKACSDCSGPQVVVPRRA